MPRASRSYLSRTRTELNEELIAKIRKQVSIGVPLKYAAQASGIAEQSIHTYLRELESGESAKGRPLTKRDVALREALAASIQEAKGEFVAKHAANITKHATDDWRASSWMLSHAPETRELFSEAGRIRIEVEKRLDSITDVLQRELSDSDFERVLSAISESVAAAELEAA